MPATMVIRYITKPDRADENEQLIRAVFAELGDLAPPGVRYTSLRLEDGVSFVHIVTIDGEQNPLLGLPAFAQFQEGIAERCAEGPTPVRATVLGAYSPA